MKQLAKENLLQIKALLTSIKPDSYQAKPEVLCGATVGQHIRHLLEFYALLFMRKSRDTISYDRRERDEQLELHSASSIALIDRLIQAIETFCDDDKIIFEADYSLQGDHSLMHPSSAGRELAFCIEHSIHHQAIIKAALVEMGLTHLVDKEFGMAYSTLRHQQSQCAQ